MEALVKNAADAEQVKDAKRKERFGRDSDLNDLREILATPGGRRFVWRYLAECRVFESSFDETHRMAFHEGKRNIGLKLLAEVTEASAEAYLVMMNEAKRRG